MKHKHFLWLLRASFNNTNMKLEQEKKGLHFLIQKLLKSFRDLASISNMHQKFQKY